MRRTSGRSHVAPFGLAGLAWLLIAGPAGAVTLPLGLGLEFLSNNQPPDIQLADTSVNLDLPIGVASVVEAGTVRFDPGAVEVPAGARVFGIVDVFVGPIAVYTYFSGQPAAEHRVAWVRDPSANELSVTAFGGPLTVAIPDPLVPVFGGVTGIRIEPVASGTFSGPVTVPADGAPLEAPLLYRFTLLPEPSVPILVLGVVALGIWRARIRAMGR